MAALGSNPIWPATAQEPVKDHAKRVDIGRCCNDFSFNLLGTCVFDVSIDSPVPFVLHSSRWSYLPFQTSVVKQPGDSQVHNLG